MRPIPPGTPGGQHDWRNFETCDCGQRGCYSYRRKFFRQSIVQDDQDDVQG